MPDAGFRDQCLLVSFSSYRGIVHLDTDRKDFVCFGSGSGNHICPINESVCF